jgi:hypothetical protein
LREAPEILGSEAVSEGEAELEVSNDAAVEEATSEPRVARLAEAAAASSGAAPELVPPPTATHGIAASGRASGDHARNRLALARLVLDAGFAGDAVKAAYQALAASIAARLPAPTSDHASLVAAIFRELMPRGQLPAAAHAALARLHDLTTLDAHGVSVSPVLAQSAVQEAADWVERIAAEPRAPGQSDETRANGSNRASVHAGA